MTFSLESWFTQRWYGKPGALLLLFPLECLFRFLVSRRFRSRRISKADVQPVVVVVGNVSVGGTGKTPAIVALVEHLQAQSIRVGVVSRGYGRKSQGLICADAQTSVDDLGDEAFLIYRRCDCPVVVSEDRVEAVECLHSRFECDVVLSDDGLQHYKMPRHFEIAMVDGGRMLGNEHLLPVGPLREPLKRLENVDWLIVNGAQSDSNALPNAMNGNCLASIVPQNFVHIRSGKEVSLDTFKGKGAVTAVAGIGNPGKFFKTLRDLKIGFQERFFRDHYNFTKEDFTSLDNETVIMTEKDAVKCKEFVGEYAYYLKVALALPDAFYASFNENVVPQIKERSQ